MMPLSQAYRLQRGEKRGPSHGGHAGHVRNQTEGLRTPKLYSLCEHTDRMTTLHSFLCRRKSTSLPLSGKRFTMGCSFTWRFQR